MRNAKPDPKFTYERSAISACRRKLPWGILILQSRTASGQYANLLTSKFPVSRPSCLVAPPRISSGMLDDLALCAVRSRANAAATPLLPWTRDLKPPQ